MSRPETFEEIVDSIWTLLERGASDRREPFHCPALATAGASGPSVRTVILRKVFRAERVLLAHSDRRASKIAEIEIDPRVTWVFYDARRKVQVRASGIAAVHTVDDLAQRQWAASMVWSRRGYASLAPGTPLQEPGSGLPPELSAEDPDLKDAEAGRANFAVLRCTVHAFDWLYLDARGHRRAKVRWDDAGEWTASWVVP
jgi:hypothetical protein